MISSYQVLVDTSVWISWFNYGNQPELDVLIKNGLICTNDIVLTELIPILRKQNQNEVIESLLSFPKLDSTFDWEIIREYQHLNLMNGINKVGIPDLMILNQIISEKLTLFSLDKHFKLMQSLYSFDLI